MAIMTVHLMSILKFLKQVEFLILPIANYFCSKDFNSITRRSPLKNKYEIGQYLSS
jgi:hypothetical protein